MAKRGHSKRGPLQSFLPLRNGISSHDTFSTGFGSGGDSKVVPGLRPVCPRPEGVLAIDGKTLHRSYDRAEVQLPLKSLALFDMRAACPIAQVVGYVESTTPMPRAGVHTGLFVRVTRKRRTTWTMRIAPPPMLVGRPGNALGLPSDSDRMS